MRRGQILKEVWIKDKEVLGSDNLGGDRYVDYLSYEGACKAIAKQDALINTLIDVVKVQAKYSNDPDVRQYAMDLVLKIAKLRGDTLDVEAGPVSSESDNQESKGLLIT